MSSNPTPLTPTKKAEIAAKLAEVNASQPEVVSPPDEIRPPDKSASAAPIPSSKNAFVYRGKGPRLHGTKPDDPDFVKKRDAALEKYVILEELPDGSRYPYRAECSECAFQTHQMTKSDAEGAVMQHAVRHLYQI